MSRHEAEQGSHFLLAGVGADASFLGRLVSILPADGYGQFFLESGGAIEMEYWPGPAGIIPSWLRRDQAMGSAQSPAQPGSLLVQALSAWTDEWLPEPGPAFDLPYTIWIGGAGIGEVDAFCAYLEGAYPGLHLHHPEPPKEVPTMARF